ITLPAAEVLSRCPQAQKNSWLHLPLVLRSHQFGTFRRRSCRTSPMPKKKRPAFPAERFCLTQRDALINFNKVRIAGADYSLRIYEAVHVNRDPTAIREHEVRVPDQPEMVRPELLDEEFFRMSPKTEHFAVTRPE